MPLNIGQFDLHSMTKYLVKNRQKQDDLSEATTNLLGI